MDVFVGSVVGDNTVAGAPEDLSFVIRERIFGEQCLAMPKLCCCGFVAAIYPWFCKTSPGIYGMHILQWKRV